MTVSLNGMTLPSWASHLQHKLAPPPLLLVQAYVNTLDLDLHTDMLAHADEAQAWLADTGLRDLGQQTRRTGDAPSSASALDRQYPGRRL